MPPKKMKVAPTPGRGLQFLKEIFSLPAGDHRMTVCRVGHVLLTYLTHNPSRTKTVSWVKETFGFLPKDSHIQNLVIRGTSLMKYAKQPKGLEQFQSFCDEVFIFRYPPGETKPPEYLVPSTSATSDTLPVSDPLFSLSQMPVASTSSVGPSNNDPGRAPLPSTPTWKKPRASSSMTPRKVMMRKRLEFVTTSLVQQRKRQRDKLQITRKSKVGALQVKTAEFENQEERKHCAF